MKQCRESDYSELDKKHIHWSLSFNMNLESFVMMATAANLFAVIGATILIMLNSFCCFM